MPLCANPSVLGASIPQRLIRDNQREPVFCHRANSTNLLSLNPFLLRSFLFLFPHLSTCLCVYVCLKERQCVSSVYSTGYCGMGEWGRLQVEEYESVLVTLAALKIFIPTDAPLNIFFPWFLLWYSKGKATKYK